MLSLFKSWFYFFYSNVKKYLSIYNVLYLITCIFFIFSFFYIKNKRNDDLEKIEKDFNDFFDNCKKKLNELSENFSQENIENYYRQNLNQNFLNDEELKELYDYKLKFKSKLNEIKERNIVNVAEEEEMIKLLDENAISEVLNYVQKKVDIMVSNYEEFLNNSINDGIDRSLSECTLELGKIFFNFEQSLTYLSTTNILTLLQVYDSLYISQNINSMDMSWKDANPILESFKSFDKDFSRHILKKDYYSEKFLNCFYDISVDLLKADNIELMSNNEKVEKWLERNISQEQSDIAFEKFESKECSKLNQDIIWTYIKKSIK